MPGIFGKARFQRPDGAAAAGIKVDHIESKLLIIPYFRPSIGQSEIEEVVDSLRSGWLTTGPKVNRFEQEFASYVGAQYAVAMNSCTAALHLALEAIGIQRGDLVLVPTMTFGATAEVVRYFDAVPVLVDCNRNSCLDTDALKKTISAINSGIPVAGLNPPYGPLKAVIPMHYGGCCCDMARIMEIAREFSLEVIEDAAHAFPSQYRPDTGSDWTYAGRFGKVGCFSFYANKCITTGEGGMAVTDDGEIAERLRLMSLHGMSKDAWKRYTAQGSWYYELVAPGYKYNLTDLAAAIGIHQLARAEEFRLRREAIAHRYSEVFQLRDELETPGEAPETRVHSWHLYPLRLNLERLDIDRAEFIEQLKQKGVSCSVHWMPLHMHPYYRQTYNLHEGLFAVAERQWLREISLPIFPDMQDQELEYVCRCVIEVTESHSKR